MFQPDHRPSLHVHFGKFHSKLVGYVNYLFAPAAIRIRGHGSFLACRVVYGLASRAVRGTLSKHDYYCRSFGLSDQRWECYFAIVVQTLIFCLYRAMDKSVYSQFDMLTVENVPPMCPFQKLAPNMYTNGTRTASTMTGELAVIVGIRTACC